MKGSFDVIWFFLIHSLFVLMWEGVGKVSIFDVGLAFTFCVSRVFKREDPAASDGGSFLKRVEEDL